MPRKRITGGAVASSFHFIDMSDPADKAWQRKVRACAASSAYIKAEKQWQQQQQQQQQQVHEKHDLQLGETAVVHRDGEAAPEMTPQIQGLDPFNTLVRRISHLESHLLDHCVPQSLD